MTRPSPSDDDLGAFELVVRRALRDGADGRRLTILGYGEVTTVFALDDAWACKRLPNFSREADAEKCAAVIRRYVQALGSAGVEVLPTDVRLVASPPAWSIYCLQPRLAPSALGPARLRERGLEAALQDLDAVLRALERSVSPRLAPDGQLSNWAFVGDRMLYLDVTSPFMRDERGRDEIDWRQHLRSLPAPLRPVALRWIVPHLLDKYFTLRGQLVDLLGNLKKERLEHLSEPFREHVNARFALQAPITRVEVERYYRSDARTYAFLQAARRADRWLQRRVLAREYPYLLPPRLDRNV
jgi:hypothetical protein